MFYVKSPIPLSFQNLVFTRDTDNTVTASGEICPSHREDEKEGDAFYYEIRGPGSFHYYSKFILNVDLTKVPGTELKVVDRNESFLQDIEIAEFLDVELGYTRKKSHGIGSNNRLNDWSGYTLGDPTPDYKVIRKSSELTNSIMSMEDINSDMYVEFANALDQYLFIPLKGILGIKPSDLILVSTDPTMASEIFSGRTYDNRLVSTLEVSRYDEDALRTPEGDGIGLELCTTRIESTLYLRARFDARSVWDATFVFRFSEEARKRHDEVIREMSLVEVKERDALEFFYLIGSCKEVKEMRKNLRESIVLTGVRAAKAHYAKVRKDPTLLESISKINELFKDGSLTVERSRVLKKLQRAYVAPYLGHFSGLAAPTKEARTKFCEWLDKKILKPMPDK